MKELIISVVLSTLLFFTSLPSFSMPISTFYNSESRAGGTYSENYNNNLSKAGAKYAYWRHWHRGGWNRGYWHRGSRWHRGHRWHRWRR